MKRFLLIFIFIIGYVTLHGQTVIAKQSFETSGDTWTPLNFSTPPCTVGNDIWDYVTSLPGITANDGNQFWGIRDLDGNCGGNGFESIIFPNVAVSSFTNVNFSFDYNARNFDNNEDLKYELFYDGVSQGEVIVVDGVNNNSDNTNGWLTETVTLPNSINSVSVVLSARCNANNERAGFDNVLLTEGTSSGLTNDDCSGAIVLTVGTDSTQNIVTGTNVGATDSGELPEPNCANYKGGDLWYTAQVPASGLLTIETLNTGGIGDTGIVIYTGFCGNLSEINCDDNSGAGQLSQINITNLSNTIIYIRVWEKNNNNFGDFGIVAYTQLCPFTTNWNGSNWDNGSPNSFTSAVLNGNYDTVLNGSFDTCDCTINSGNTVNIRGGNYIQVENDLTVNGTLEVRHEGSLVMVQDDGIVTSPGTTNIHKTTTPFNDPLDYTYWSSPTINETFGSALASSRADRIFEFDIVSGWIAKSGSDIMQTAEGYLAGAPRAGTFPQSQSVVFDGVVNNGIIKTPAFQAINFNWNFIGNPYPSAVDADLFLDDPLNTSIVNGTIYLWTHNTPISDANPDDEKYNYSTSDYATYTAGIGGTAAVSGGTIPTGFIASAQGFFAQGLTNGEATFNNSMRTTANNNQLFKTATTSTEKDRIWLNLYNNKGAFSQILIGFIENGTDGIDRYDGSKFGGNYISFYSIIEDEFFATQSKPTIKDEETIKLGLYSYLEEGDSLKISIENIEGQLHNYNIYLKDKLLNRTHDLNIEDYKFLPEPQSFYDDRFELVLTKSQVLNTDEIYSEKDELLVSQLENSVEIKTTNTSTISQLRIYDLLGKTVINVKPNTTLYSLNTNSIPKGTVLLLSMILDTNEVLTSKVIIY